MITITWDNVPDKVRGMGVLQWHLPMHTLSWAEEVAQEGAREIRNIIDIGGVNPTIKGGPRIKTGGMRDAVIGRGRLPSNRAATVTAEAGWEDPGHEPTIWQERGTRKLRIKTANPKRKPNGKIGGGIPPMLSIPMAEKAMSEEMKPAGAKMLNAIRKEWDAI